MDGHQEEQGVPAAADANNSSHGANEDGGEVDDHVDGAATSLDQEEALARALFLPDYLKGPIDQSRMQLTPQERAWAMQVKQAIQDHPETNHLSDFMYAQIALVEWESRSLENAIELALNLQVYCQEHDVLDTFRQGRDAIDFCIRSNPGYVLHFFLAEDRYRIIFDMKRFDISVLSNPKDLKKTMIGGYYFFHETLGRRRCFDR